jgi:hypothetical protein
LNALLGRTTFVLFAITRLFSELPMMLAAILWYRSRAPYAPSRRAPAAARSQRQQHRQFGWHQCVRP